MKNLTQISWSVQGIAVSLMAYGAPTHCLFAQVGAHSLLRFNGLISLDQAQELQQILCQQLALPLKISVLQLEQPDQKWEEITTGHILWTYLKHIHSPSLQVSHLNLPAAPLYKLESEFRIKEMTKLSQWQNFEGWHTYCHWLYEKMNKLVETFPLEAMHVYTLQAQLLDFIHEVRASLEEGLEQNLSTILLKEGESRGLLPALVPSGEEDLILEKMLIKGRSRLHDKLQLLYEQLTLMLSTLKATENHHPTLHQFHLQVAILQRLLKSMFEVSPISWVEQALLLTLLNQELGIVTLVTGNGGHKRSRLFFVLSLALLVLTHKIPFSHVCELVFQWKETTQGLSKHAALLTEFRQLFITILENLTVAPFATKSDPELSLSAEILELFPQSFIEEGKLSSAGHSLLMRL